MSNLAGQTIGKYKLLERLGSGGMAEVYKANHPKLNRTVAVKILHGYLAEGEDFLARFEREACAVADLRHPHIVQIHDFEIDNEMYYMVMEFIDGGTLQKRMADLARNGQYMSLHQVLAIMDQVAKALDYAHKKGIIHRDIKPSNIMLSSSGEAFLTDFGIARIVSTTQFTSTGGLIGTPTYMSPEQGKGLELTAASDIYSLGVILHELLTGQAPFISDTPLALIQKHINEPLRHLGSLRPGLPVSVEVVINKALAKDPAQRYQSAGELTQSLARALTKEVIVRLDAESAKAKKPIASQLTERIEVESNPPSKSQMPTMAMGEKTQAEIGKPPVVRREPASKPGIKKPPVNKKPLQKSQPLNVKAAGKAPVHPPTHQVKSRPVILVVIGLIVIVILFFALSGLNGGSSCSSVDECMARTTELQGQGDLDGALAALDKATSMVPSEQHADYAWIWCDRANLLEQMGRVSQSGESREICASWERGE